MTLTQITASGQIALPPEIIHWLKLQPGDAIEIAISPDGKVYLEPAKIDVRTLSGILYQEGRNPVSLEEMDSAMSDCAGESV